MHFSLARAGHISATSSLVPLSLCADVVVSREEGRESGDGTRATLCRSVSARSCPSFPHGLDEAFSSARRDLIYNVLRGRERHSLAGSPVRCSRCVRPRLVSYYARATPVVPGAGDIFHACTRGLAVAADSLMSPWIAFT